MNLSDIKKFPPLYWLILLMVFFSCSSIWSILWFTNKWINLRFCISEVQTGNLISYTFLIELLLVPFMGWVGDKYTQHRTKMLAMHVVTFVAFICIFTFWPSCTGEALWLPTILGLVLYAISFALW
jgi:nitrate/nitrite transporter NarK